MTSPFLRNRQRKLATLSGQASAPRKPIAPDAKTEAGQEYATLKVRLDDQLRQLQDTASHEARIPMKAQFAKGYAAWVRGVIEADQPVQDEILMTCFVWAIDCGFYEDAVEMGAFAIRHDLAMPERYSRSVACFLREDVAEIELQKPGTVSLELLAQIDELTTQADMPDPARAKLHKALGRAWRTKADAFDASDENAPAGGEAAFVTVALGQLKRAFELDKNAGVKKDIDQLERRLAKLQAAGSDGAGGQQ